MPMSIKPTPVLGDESAEYFNMSVARMLNEPLRVTKLPCLNAAKKAVFGCDELDKIKKGE